MKTQMVPDAVYAVSDVVIAREIEDEIILIPLPSDLLDQEKGLYTINPAGQAIWRRLDGVNRLKDIVKDLSAEYNIPTGQMEKDVHAFVKEMLKRKLLVLVSGT